MPRSADRILMYNQTEQCPNHQTALYNTSYAHWGPPKSVLCVSLHSVLTLVSEDSLGLFSSKKIVTAAIQKVWTWHLNGLGTLCSRLIVQVMHYWRTVNSKSVGRQKLELTSWLYLTMSSPLTKFNILILICSYIATLMEWEWVSVSSEQELNYWEQVRIVWEHFGLWFKKYPSEPS